MRGAVADTRAERATLDFNGPLTVGMIRTFMVSVARAGLDSESFVTISLHSRGGSTITAERA